jgi:hypothetical protein
LEEQLKEAILNDLKPEKDHNDLDDKIPERVVWLDLEDFDKLLIIDNTATVCGANEGRAARRPIDLPDGYHRYYAIAISVQTTEEAVN